MGTVVKTNEKERLKDVKRLNILDTLPEKDFDAITKLASNICGTPVSVISIIDQDRQWFKSKVGLEISETPRSQAFCHFAIQDPENVMEVEDAMNDPRFDDNPLVHTNDHPVISYTGIPLISDRGFAIGTLCTIDYKPRKLEEDQIQSLKLLASQVVKMFELRKANIDLNRTSKELKKRYDELEMFAGVVSHDMKSPLANITLTIDTLKKKLELYDLEDESVDTYLQYLKNSAMSMSSYIQGMLDYYRSDHSSNDEIVAFKLRAFVKEIIGMLNVNDSYEIALPPKGIEIVANKTALEQVFLNILNNSIKYCDKERPVIEVLYADNSKDYRFIFKDNGPGIKPEDQKKIFELFNTLNVLDRNGKRGTGIGLATVKKLVGNMDGKIEVTSVLREGTSFTVTIPKPYEVTIA